MTRILIAVDGSDESRRALGYAGRLMEVDVVTVIAVVPVLIEAPRTVEYTDPAHDPAESRRHLDEARAILAEAGVEAETITAMGNPADEILRAAEARAVKLIVIGRRGLHAPARFIIGSVSDRVVRHAHCDVLVVG